MWSPTEIQSSSSHYVQTLGFFAGERENPKVRVFHYSMVSIQRHKRDEVTWGKARKSVCAHTNTTVAWLPPSVASASSASSPYSSPSFLCCDTQPEVHHGQTADECQRMDVPSWPPSQFPQ
uniref:Uncharacterized protein n=1 Tax=Bionectria ochroleuca TaxID=29856 RepID=A0A8H7N8I0_BIOOC